MSDDVAARTEPAATAADPTTPEFRKRRLKATVSAYLGFMMDTYAIFVPITALTPALAYFQNGVDPGFAALIAAMTLAATLLGRPLGAFLFGALADKIGRQRIGFVTIFGFGGVTILIACLPGAQTVGPAVALTLLLILRFLDGIFLGGEYTAATPMAVEYAPAKRRGLYGGIVQSSASMGQLIGSLVIAITLAFFASGDINSPYTQWGWRIPFVVGGILSIGVAVFLRRQVPESDVQKAVGIANPNAVTLPAKNPLRDLFGNRENMLALVQVFVIMNGAFFMINLGSGVLNPSILLRNRDIVTPSQYALIGIVSGLVGISGYIGSGWLSDRLGRKRALIVGAIITGILGPLAMMTVPTGVLPNVWLVGFFHIIALMSIGTVAGIAPSYFNERFPTEVRSSGWGIGYSTAVIIPSFSAAYIAGLDRFLPTGVGGALLWILAAVLVLVGLALGPETRGLDLTRVRAAPTRP